MKTYSRRELYALGEPIGESATRLKPGGRVYGAGGGGFANLISSVQGAGNVIPAAKMNVLGNAAGQPAVSPTSSAAGAIQNLGATSTQPTAQPAGPAPFSSSTASPVTAAPSQTPMTQVESQAGVSDFARPFVETMLGATQQQLFNYDPYGNVTGMQGYTPYSYNPADYFAAFTPLQQQAQAGISGLTSPYQTQLASGYLSNLINRAAGTGYRPTAVDVAPVSAPGAQAAQLGAAPTVEAAQMQGPQATAYQAVGAPGMTAAQMQAAQTGYSPALQTFQMGAAPQVSTGAFTDQAQAYMSPYIQQALAPQLAEARRQADIASTRLGAQAAGAGAFGGSRYGIERAEQQRNLATQLAGITGQGYNQAYQQAMQQYSTDAARQLAAQQANQQAGLTTGQQNLAAQLGVQQLGTQTGLQTALQNLSNVQQANVQNQAAQLQAQGMNAQQALQAALANQQAGMTTQQFNAQQAYNTALQNAQMRQQAALANQGLLGQFGLQQGQFGQAANILNAQQGLQAALANQQAQQAANQLRAQQAQYGAGLGLQGLQAAMSGAGQLGGLGTSALQNQLGILGAQQQTGALQQQQQQQIINQAIQNYQTAQQYPYQQLGFMRGMLQGLPIGTTSQQSYQQAPSVAQNLAALGMGAYGLGQLFGTNKPTTVVAPTAGAAAPAGGGGIGGIPGILNTVGGGIGDLIGKVGGLFGFDEGGQVKGYADGGSVESTQNVADIVGRLSDQQLQQAEQAAMSRGDFDQLQAVQKERALRASERGGLGGAFNMLPAPARGAMMAGGGIVAFADRGLVYSPEGIPVTGEYTTEEDELTPLERLGILNPENRRAVEAIEAAEKARKSGRTAPSTSAIPEPYGASRAPVVTDVTPKPPRQAGPAAPQVPAGPNYIQMLQERLNQQQNTPIPQAGDREEEIRKNIEMRQRMVGDNPAIAAMQRMIEQQQGERESALQQGKGLAALAAMRGMLQPGGFVKGLGESGALFGEAYGKTLAADKEAARLTQQMQINMANAEYQQKVGNYDKAEEAREKGLKAERDLYALRMGKTAAEAKTIGEMAGIEQRQRELEEQRRFHGAQLSQPTAIQKLADDMQRADPSLTRKEALNEASRLAGYGFRTEAAGELAREKGLEKDFGYVMLTMKLAAAKTPQEKQQIAAEMQQYVEQKRALLSGAKPAQSKAGWSAEQVGG